MSIERPANEDALAPVAAMPEEAAAPEDVAAPEEENDPPRLKVRMSGPEERAFEARLRNSRIYLEYGSGGSTELALRSPARCIVSIESDRRWVDELKSRPLVAKALEKARLHLVHVDIGPVGAWGMPQDHSKARMWHRYYTHPFTALDFSYDFILIDGRFRQMCAYTAYFCAPDDATIAIHDYHNRTRYFDVESFFDIEDVADSLYFFKKRARINMKNMYLSAVRHAVLP